MYLAHPSLLSKPLSGEVLYVHLAMLEKAVSSVLVLEKNKIQMPISYSSMAFQEVELRYTPLEKLALPWSYRTIR